MKKRILRGLSLIMVMMLLPVGALAAKVSITPDGVIGFMYEGGSVTVRPSAKNISRDELIWTTSDSSVATVAGGTISAHRAGRVIITASGGGARARCGVVVLPSAITLEQGSTYSLPYGTVEQYTIKDPSVASISRTGVITGKKAGATYLRVAYGRQKLYLTINVTASAAAQSAAAWLDCANDTNQIILVEYQGNAKANLTIHEKRSGVWTQLYSTTAYVGSSGIGKTREGDKKTPSGTFNLTTPFGIKSDPGANMPYTKVTKYHYWCGTSGSQYYNKPVNTRKVNRAPTSSDEYLINYKGYYNYCLFIDYNAAGSPGKGSCIFLHCTGSKKSTSGCIAVPENIMKNIVRWVQPGAKIVIR